MLSCVTVEPIQPNEDVDQADLPSARSIKVQQLLADDARRGSPECPLQIRRGQPVPEILAAVARADASVLVVGYRRGGPAREVSPTETARNLLYAAPCAVLTVPF
jgi:nucleotide-binding universal stress UspA family protein